jgi:hypothetical protein
MVFGYQRFDRDAGHLSGSTTAAEPGKPQLGNHRLFIGRLRALVNHRAIGQPAAGAFNRGPFCLVLFWAEYGRRIKFQVKQNRKGFHPSVLQLPEIGRKRRFTT